MHLTEAVNHPVQIDHVRQALAHYPLGDCLETDVEPAAAVAAILLPRASDTEVMLIERVARSGDPWSGHMALPGGRREAGDADLLATATRETGEEVGLDLVAHGTLLGRLPTVPTRSREPGLAMAVSPFVFALPRPPPTQIGPEVSSIVWAPREPLIRVGRSSQLAVTAGGKSVELPGWRVQGYVVWEITDQIPTLAPGHVESGRRMIL